MVMALKLFPIPFPIFAQPHPYPEFTHPSHRPTTEVRFSRWKNANPEKFHQGRRAQQEIEDDSCFNTSSAHSKNPKFSQTGPDSHPAFRRASKITKTHQKVVNERDVSRRADVRVSNDGLSYVIEGAPFEFKYSYTEAPKVKPLKLREAAFAPFGPTTTPRPWTGKPPREPSKKKLREFDSFRLPPPHKKGVKPVQAPGPYLPGTGPRYVKTREEILGEPLTKAEVKDLISSCLKSRRQLNMGRDGLTHNMLDNIHAHWKRRRVCKIKCIGVCTVDMDNVCQQLEEKTGGKIIFRKGGVLYLFRGRNYNYRFRPKFPLMLWKPITPVYPKLIERAPDGLTLEEAAEMRKKGRKLIPIRKLAKNGVYCYLVSNVREAFEECELVRINCQGMNASDYRKIGAKLRDLVPCVLISFEREHILMWRGRDWKSSLIKGDGVEAMESRIDGATSTEPPLENKEIGTLPVKDASVNGLNTNASTLSDEEQEDTVSEEEIDEWYATMDKSSNTMENHETRTLLGSRSDTNIDSGNHSEDMGNIRAGDSDNESQSFSSIIVNGEISENIGSSSSYNETEELSNVLASDAISENIITEPDTSPSIEEVEKLQVVSEGLHDVTEQLSMAYMEGITQLWKQAIESGRAVVLDDSYPDADIVYKQAVALAKSAPPGPVFSHQRRRAAVEKSKKQESRDSEVTMVAKKGGSEGKTSKPKPQTQSTKKFNDQHLEVVSQGGLQIDELAKLLS